MRLPRACGALRCAAVMSPPPPPALVTPAAYEVSFGHIVGIAPQGARAVVVRAGGRVLARRRIRGPRFDFVIALPRGETTIRVTAGRRTFTAPHVIGLPQGARPRGTRPHLDAALQQKVLGLTRSCMCGVYVQSLTSGAGAAWNARARFPAASTLKVAIAVTALSAFEGSPAPGSTLDGLLRRMLVESDNGAANAVEVMLAGSTGSGGARVNTLMRSIGLVDSEMFGGYLRETQSRSIPLRVERQPYFGRGKYTSAYDLARLLAYVHLAAEGRGPLRRALTARDARYLLYLLARVGDRGKLGRSLPVGAALLHKAGWISTARHDAGLVYHAGGVFVAVVTTYGTNGSADALAGRVAAVSFRRFRSSPES